MAALDKTDPELIRQLDDAAGSGRSVEAAVSIKRVRGQRPNPDRVQLAVQEAVARASEASGTEAEDVHVMPNIAVAYVKGPGELIRSLIQQPEVVGAAANESVGDTGTALDTSTDWA